VVDEVGFGFITGEGSLWGSHPVTEKPTSLAQLATLEKDRLAANVLAALLMREGVFVSAPVHLGFIAAHTEADIDVIINAHITALREMKERGFIG
jgi:hypothetical protein